MLVLLVLILYFWPRTDPQPESASVSAPAPSVEQGQPLEGDQETESGARASQSTVSDQSQGEAYEPVAVGAPTSTPDLRFGLLRETQPDQFLSPAGLRYLPGSAEGHRLQHLRRHTKDQPDRPGMHGVFDGGMEGALIAVDEAYVQARRGDRTKLRQDRDRTIYTVDLGRRVGYVGGREGKRLHHPIAKQVRMVLEDNRVITAYPYRSR